MGKILAVVPLAVVLAVAALPALQPALSSQLHFAMQEDVARMSGAGHDIRKSVIADGIYQFTTMRDSYVRLLNSVVIVNQNDVLVFDTNTRPSSARIVLEEVRKITNKPVRYVVNSHHHPDHWSGNEVYAEAFPGLEIIASEQAAELMHNTVPLWGPRFSAELKRRQAAVEEEKKTGKQPDGTVLTAGQRQKDEDDLRDYQSFVEEALAVHRTFPTLTYSQHLTLQHGGREFRFMNVTGDAEGTTMLYLPREKVLITGDAVSYPMPYINPHLSAHANDLRALARLDVAVIIPGHGPAFHDKNYLLLEIELIDRVIQGVHEALQKGMQTLDEVQKAVTLDDLREQFAHGDPDLEARFPARVKEFVKYAIREAGQDYQ